MAVVAVDAAELDFSAVHVNNTVDDLNALESGHVDNALTICPHLQSVKAGLLVVPKSGSVNVDNNAVALFRA
jgi:hypothetical protein